MIDFSSLFGKQGGAAGPGSMGLAGILGPLGMLGGAGLSSLMTSSANKKAEARLREADAMIQEGESRQLTKTAAGRRELDQAKVVTRAQTDAAKRESLAATQMSQSLMDRQIGQQMAQASAMAGARGLSGTTAGLGMMGAMQGSLMNAIAQSQMQGAQARSGLNMQMAGQLANLSGQQAGLFGQEAQIIGKNAETRANMLAQFSPTVDTGFASMLSGLGGQMVGAQFQSLLGPSFAQGNKTA